MPVSVFEVAAEPGEGGKRVQGQDVQTVSHKIIKFFRDATKILLRFIGQVLGKPRRAPRRLFVAATGATATRAVARAKDCERNGVSQSIHVMLSVLLKFLLRATNCAFRRQRRQRRGFYGGTSDHGAGPQIKKIVFFSALSPPQIFFRVYPCSHHFP